MALKLDSKNAVYWFVGASYGGASQDQTERFLKEGIWQNGYTDKYLDIVKSMEVGQRIAIKAAYTRKGELPFDNRGNVVSVMAIKATGTVKKNRGDGRTIEVVWDPQGPAREWYFYTNRGTIWKVEPGKESTDELIAFAFEGKAQDISRFRNKDFWKERFGDRTVLDEGNDTALEKSSSQDSSSGAMTAASPNKIVLQRPLNQILYGPPGTGKTFNSIRCAVEIIDGRVYPNYQEAKRRFDDLRRAGRIGFVTFHQSFSYEDFVEGIRPVMNDTSSTTPRYEIRDGVLKQMALLALDSIVEQAKTPTATFDSAWSALVQKVELNPRHTYSGLTDKSSFTLTMQDTGIEGENVKSDSKNNFFFCSRSDAEAIWTKFRAAARVNSNDVYKSLPGSKGHGGFIATVVNILKEPPNIVPALLDNSSNHRRMSHRYLHAEQNYTLKDEREKYVLIIDEINRGNVSKILGELITLLEPDKRIGAKHALSVTLPYSGDNFALPPNLHLVGTMNTADKSLALLDVALRRRFKFYEIPPDFRTCAQLPAEARHAIETLNHRIVLTKDRDHRIGHSFFIDVATVDNFNEVFRSEIIPLLQEYFYNDWEGLRFSLGEAGEGGSFIRSLGTQKSRGVRNRWQWYFDAGQHVECLQALANNYARRAEELQIPAIQPFEDQVSGGAAE